MAKATEEKTEIARRSLNISDVGGLTSWDDAIGFLQEEGIQVTSISDVEEFLGDGFTYVQKPALVNMPFVVLHVRHTMSPSFDVPMTTVRAMTATNRRVKFTDFSTGIHEQLKNFEERSGRSSVGLLINRGLTASEYEVEGEDGKKIRATTFYLNLEG